MREKDALLQGLDQGEYDETLCSLYGDAADGAARIRSLVKGWEQTFGPMEGRECGIFSAPGRTELGGNHTDHQGGWAIGGCIHLDTIGCVVFNQERWLRVQSKGHRLCCISLDELTPKAEEQGTSTALLRGVAARIEAMGYPLRGMDIYTETRVPRASGVSSSAAFEILVAKICNDLCCGGALSDLDLAYIGQYAENIFYGKPCGLLDQLSCALGGVLAVNFKVLEAPKIDSIAVDFAAAGYTLCIVDLGKGHGSLDADYAAIPAEMSRVAGCFGRKLLSDVSEEDFYSHLPSIRRECGDRAVMRGIHYFDENRRAMEMIDALKNRDIARHLRLVNESGRSSFMYLQNVSLYRDPRMQDAALALALAEKFLGEEGACRIHGGGFAGTIQAYVPTEKYADFSMRMDQLTGKNSCYELRVRHVGPTRLA